MRDVKVIIETEDGRFVLGRSKVLRGRWYLDATVNEDYEAATLDGDDILLMATIVRGGGWDVAAE